MNTEPPPFGDPTNIQRENAAAVRKGVAFGCGGCLAIILAGVCFMIAIIGIVFYAIRASDPIQLTLKAAQRSEVVQQELGEPISLGWLVLGNIQTVNNEGTANLSLSLSGPKGDADVQVQGQKKDGVWNFSQMEAVLPSGSRVDLRGKSAPSL